MSALPPITDIGPPTNWCYAVTMSTGSLSTATYPTDAITIRCNRCERMGWYKRQTLIERYGHDAAMPDVLKEITASGRNQRLSVERCTAYFEELRAQVARAR